MNAAEKYDLDRVVRLVLSLGLAVGCYLLISTLADILIPFAVAVLLAYLLNPLVTHLERRIGSRTAAVLVTVAALIAIALSAVVILVPLVSSEFARFQTLLDQLRDGSSAVAQRLRAAFANSDDPRVGWLQQRIKAFLVSDDFNQLVRQAAGVAVPTAWGLVTGALRIIAAGVGLTLVLVYLVFVLIDYRSMSRRWKDYLPPNYRDAVVEFIEVFRKAMGRYFRGQFIVATLTGCLFSIGFSLIGLPLAIGMGLLIGLLNMVPYLQTIAFLPCCLLGVVRAVETGSGVLTSLALVITVFAVVQVIMDGALAPRILGQAVGLRPAVIMLSVFVWGRLLGFLGLVLAIPLTCLGLAYYKRFVLTSAAGSSDSPAASR